MRQEYRHTHELIDQIEQCDAVREDEIELYRWQRCAKLSHLIRKRQQQLR